MSDRRAKNILDAMFGIKITSTGEFKHANIAEVVNPVNMLVNRISTLMTERN